MPIVGVSAELDAGDPYLFPEPAEIVVSMAAAELGTFQDMTAELTTQILMEAAASIALSMSAELAPQLTAVMPVSVAMAADLTTSIQLVAQARIGITMKARLEATTPWAPVTEPGDVWTVEVEDARNRPEAESTRNSTEPEMVYP